MLKIRGTVLLITALALPLVAEPAAAKKSFTFSDPAGDVTGPEGAAVAPNDIVGVELSSDGEFIVIAVTLAAAPKPVSLFDALVAGIVFDVDDDRKSGGQGFGGMYGDVPGIDFESEILANVDEGAASTSSAASVISVDAKGNQANVLGSSDAPSTPAKGKVFTGKVAYASIGVKAGQTIRVIVRELDDRGETAGMFPEAWLTLR